MLFYRVKKHEQPVYKAFSAFLIVIIVAVGVNTLYVTQDTEQEIVVYEEQN